MLPANRRQELYDQVVLTLVNDGDWYRFVRYDSGWANFDDFRRASNKWRHNHKNRLGDYQNLEVEEVVYVNVVCWEHVNEGRRFSQEDADTVEASSGNLYKYYVHTDNTPAEQQPIKEEPIMALPNTTLAFQTKHYIYGADVEQMSDAQLIDAIKKIEAEIADLASVKTKSTKVKAKIDELQAMLKSVVEVLDAK